MSNLGFYMWDEKLNQKKNLLTKIFFKSFLLLLLANVASAFPIFPPHSAYINCNTSPGFLGDNSNTSLGFAGGTAVNVSWDGSKMVLNAAQTTGTFTSRVIDNSCIGIAKPWLNLRWTSTLPFGKELAATNELNTAYTGMSNSTLMNNIVGTWHLNESSYNGTASEVVDSSGNNRHGQMMLWAPYSYTKVAGQLNTATQSPAELYLRVTDTLVPAYQAVTFSTWYKGTVVNAFSTIGFRDGAGTAWRLQQNGTGFVYYTYQTSAGSGSGTAGSHSTNIMDGNWHHIALTVNSGAYSIWVDGTKVSGTYLHGTGFVANHFFVMGNVNGAIDEVALWSRVLTDAEILEVYRRGINRVKIQVRNCTSSTCADNPAWQGPDGTATTWFTELNNNSNQLTGLGTVQTGLPTLLFTNFPSVLRSTRYMQYKFVLETDNTTYMPNVNIVGPGR